MKLYPRDMIEHIKEVNGGRIVLNRQQVQRILEVNLNENDSVSFGGEGFYIVSRAIHPYLGILVDITTMNDFFESVRVPLSEIAQLPGDLYETLDNQIDI